MIRFIAAIDSKRGLANEHGIPWQGKVPTDVAFFRERTTGGIVMMGAGWYKEQTKPLPYRKNLVATSSLESLRDGFEKVTDAREYLQKTNDDIWVGGGAGLFESTLDLADELYLTLLDGDFGCTKFFPKYEDAYELAGESQPITENGINYRFTTWRRKK